MNQEQLDERDGFRNRRTVVGLVLWAGWVNNGRNGGNRIALEDETELEIWTTGTMNGAMVDQKVGSIHEFTLVDARGWEHPICVGVRLVDPAPEVIPPVDPVYQRTVALFKWLDSAPLVDEETGHLECPNCGVEINPDEMPAICPNCGVDLG